MRCCAVMVAELALLDASSARIISELISKCTHAGATELRHVFSGQCDGHGGVSFKGPPARPAGGEDHLAGALALPVA